jgi:hypothetical protein
MSTEIAEIVDAEMVQPVGNLFGTTDPAEVVAKATATAEALMEVVHRKELVKKIKGKDHILVEAWTLLGSMLGVFAVVEWTKEIEGGWEARAVAKTLAGQTVGAAEAECLRSESNWKNSDDYAIKSMAQTRAVSKALRAPLGFIVVLAGLNPTPAEEMPSEVVEPSDGSATKKAARERLSFALKDLAPVPVPADVTFDNWAEFAQSAMNERYGVSDSKKLSIAQLDDLTSYLRSFDDIPLTR